GPAQKFHVRLPPKRLIQKDRERLVGFLPTSTPETRAEVAYNDMLEVNFSWQGEKWMAIAPGQTFTDVHLCIYRESLDETMKERLEQRYNLAYCIPSEKIGA